MAPEITLHDASTVGPSISEMLVTVSVNQTTQVNVLHQPQTAERWVEITPV